MWVAVVVATHENRLALSLSVIGKGCKKEQVRQWLGFVQLIRRPNKNKNELYKDPNIA